MAILFFSGQLFVGCATAGPTPSQTASDRLKLAEAMFQERCKTAGEKIYRTAENVESVFLMKVRPQKPNFGDQFELDDPYGSDLGGDGYIVTFIRGSFDQIRLANPETKWPPRIGYTYVEAVDPIDGNRYRYTGAMKAVTHTSSALIGGDGKTKFTTLDFVLDRIPAQGQQTRYGVTYDDISTQQERELWIAGSSLRVVDLQTNEVMAERIGYMMDPGQGSVAGGRSPWLIAASHACPDFRRFPNPRAVPGFSAQLRQAQDFVEKVLKPKSAQGE